MDIPLQRVARQVNRQVLGDGIPTGGGDDVIGAMHRHMPSLIPPPLAEFVTNHLRAQNTLDSALIEFSQLIYLLLSGSEMPFRFCPTSVVDLLSAFMLSGNALREFWDTHVLPSDLVLEQVEKCKNWQHSVPGSSSELKQQYLLMVCVYPALLELNTPALTVSTAVPALVRCLCSRSGRAPDHHIVWRVPRVAAHHTIQGHARVGLQCAPWWSGPVARSVAIDVLMSL